MNDRCLAREHHLTRDLRAVTLENDLLAVTVLPDRGAEIHALVYKPAGVDVLWKAPWGVPRPGPASVSAAGSEQLWHEQFAGGWPEIFPNGGDACQYKGATLNFHGEASVLPWDYEIHQSPAGAEAEFTVALCRSPFHLRRRLAVESGRPVLTIHEEITSRAREPMHYMWGHHPTFGAPLLGPDCRIDLPPCIYQAHAPEYYPHSRIPAGTVAPWPFIPGKSGPVDLSRVPPEAAGVSEYGYLRDLAEGRFTLTNPRLGFGLALAWPLDVFPYAWFWQELGGTLGFPFYGSAYTMAIEPFTSIPGTGLVDAIAAGTAPIMPPFGRVAMQMTAMFFPAPGPDVQAA